MIGFLEQRVRKCQQLMKEKGIEALLITHLTNIYYLTGFSGTAATVLITASRRVFITDSRYALMAKASVEGFDIIESREPLKIVADFLETDHINSLGFEEEVTFSFYQALQKQLPKIDLLPQSGFVETLRLIKDDSEIETIAEACRITDKAFIDVLDFIKAGQTTEIEVANFLDFRMRHYGASGLSFESIVASGERSAIPHGRASHKVIENGDSLTMDFGCYYNHYVSDMTRTIHVGQVTDQEREIYDIVLKANEALIAKASAGMTYSDYDAVAREVIANAGYGSNFTHGIGHGIGLDIHENPFFTKSDQVLKAGMVVTDEPGIYIDGHYGLRIEDDLVITENGCRILTLAPKELIVI